MRQEKARIIVCWRDELYPRLPDL